MKNDFSALSRKNDNKDNKDNKDHKDNKDSKNINDMLDLSRRGFLQLLGAGLLISATGGNALAQRSGSGRQGAGTVAARLHIGEDGAVTVLTGKVEVGQGGRAELTQAAAEELRVSPDRILLVMGDTDLVPDDGITAGSRTTPSTVPAVRRAAATARNLLVDLAREKWGLQAGDLTVRDGVITHAGTGRTLTYADLAKAGDAARAFEQSIPSDVELRPVKEWEIMGTSFLRPNARDLVTGAHRFPSDIQRPDMLYGKVLRPPSYGAKLVSIDLSAAEAMEGVIAVRDGEFVGCAAPTSFQAAQAVKALAKTASWEPAPHPPSSELFAYLKKHVRQGKDGGRGAKGSVEKGLAEAAKTLRAAYEVAYVQHAPMEPRAAVAEWNDGKVTIWTGSQGPFRVHSDVTQALGVPPNQVRVIVPDTGGGFGGKHSGETAVEAARLARAAKRPVSLRWTREEEFTWAYFRPAALIEIQGGLSADGAITAWEFTNINSGAAALDTPYDVPNKKTQYVSSDPPLRQGSYRCLAATANNFARECFMDELAAAAGADPLEFRLRHLKDERLRAVLETAAKRFGWSGRKGAGGGSNVGFGLACGNEKASYVAACVEVEVDRKQGEIKVRRICEVFEPGAVQNPANLRSQVLGCIIMGLGPALREEIRFENGKILNATFREYPVPRFKHVPEIDVHLLDRKDIESAGGGETPIIAVAPAIGNAVFDATGVRIRTMPIRGEAIKQAKT